MLTASTWLQNLRQHPKGTVTTMQHVRLIGTSLIFANLCSEGNQWAEIQRQKKSKSFVQSCRFFGFHAFSLRASQVVEGWAVFERLELQSGQSFVALRYAWLDT